MKFFCSLSLSLLFIQGCALKEEIPPLSKQSAHPIQTHPSTPAPVVVKPTTPIFANAKEMQFPTIDGKIISIKGDDNLLKVTNQDYQAKEVVLYLFGRDCPHCVNEISKVRALSKNPKLKIIGIHAQKMIGDSALKAYTKKIGYNFDILSFKNDIIMIRYLRDHDIWQGGTPSHLLIDHTGNVQEISISQLLDK